MKIMVIKIISHCGLHIIYNRNKGMSNPIMPLKSFRISKLFYIISNKTKSLLSERVEKLITILSNIRYILYVFTYGTTIILHFIILAFEYVIISASKRKLTDNVSRIRLYIHVVCVSQLSEND